MFADQRHLGLAVHKATTSPSSLVFLAYFIHETVADGGWEDGGEIEYWRNGVMVYWVGGVWSGLGSAGSAEYW